MYLSSTSLRLHRAGIALLLGASLIALSLSALLIPQTANAAQPTMLSATTADTDLDGTVDQVTVVFSEAVDINDTGGAADGLDSLALTDSCTIANGDYTLAKNNTLVLTVANCTANDTSITPTVTYTSQGGAGNNFAISDTATSTEMANAANVVGTDGAAPAIIDLDIEDTGAADGLIDKITVTWSENVDTDDSAPPVIGDFGTILLPDGVAVTAATITDPAGASATVVLTAIADQVTINTAAGATAINGITTEWTDGTNATVNPDDSETVTDSAGPVVKTLTIEDTATADGLIDKITVTWSENIDTDDSAAPVIADFGTLALPDGTAVTAATITDPAGATAAVVLTDISDQSTENTAVGSTAISGDLSTFWVDGSANAPHATGGTGNETVVDSAAPAPVTVTFYDGTSNDGKLDLITVVFSENLSAAADGSADWAISSAANFSGLVEGTVECNSGSAGANECDYNFTTTTVKTNVGDLTLAYTAGTSVTDGTNNTGSLSFTSASTPAFTDGAAPILSTITKSLTSSRNILTLVYSEPITLTGGDGASSAGVGDVTTAGTVAGFGTFATAGDVTVPTTKNSVSGSGSATLIVSLANEAAGYMATTSTTEPSGVFTPAASASVIDVASNQVNTANTPTAGGDASWDLTKPTVSSITIDDAAGDNGKIDQAVIVFSEAVRDANITNGDATLGATGTTTGTFTTGTANDDTTTFNRTDDSAVDTGLGAESDFVYSGATTLITDAAGNLLNTATDGQVATADVTEIDGAAPILVSAARNQLSDTVDAVSVTFNALQFTWSEVIRPYTGGDGATGLISADSSAYSTSTLGAMTTARTIDGIATFAALDGGDVETSSATGNLMFFLSTGKSINMILNRELTAYFTAASTAPGATVVTPVSDANDIEDVAGNPVNASATVTLTLSGGWDIIAPTVSNTYSCDTDNDGIVDRVQATFSQSIIDSSITVGNFEVDNDDTNDGTGEETPASYNTATAGCDGAATDTDAHDEKVRFDLTTGITGTEAVYLHHVTAGLRDHYGNRIATGSALGTENDMAAPVVMTVSPASAATAVNKTADVVITFSEAMDTTFDEGTEFSSTPDPGTFTEAWTVGNTVVTLDHNTLLCNTSYNIVLDELNVDAAAGTVTELSLAGPEDGDWSFTTQACSSGGGGGGSTVAPTYEVSLSTPNGGESLAPGSLHTIMWTNGGTGTASYANILLSTNGGTSYQAIASNILNSGSYSWLVPNINTTEARIRIESTDLAEVLAVDASNANFTITGTGSTPSTSETPSTAPSSGQQGISPVTGLPEDISVVNPGDYIKSPYFSTVYYVDSALNRHPFMDAMTYFTWQNSFGAIKVVTDATLPTLTLSYPMLPKAGVVLVKIESDPKVYALENDPSNALAPKLRWVTSEAIAQTLYGSDWADYVIDVPVTLFARFGSGSDITDAGSITVDRSIMKKRVNLQ